MKINRRSFLAAAAAALVMDPERLLWIPGAKVYSIPKPQPVTVHLAYHPLLRVISLSINGHEIPIENFSVGVGDHIQVSSPGTDPLKLIVTRAVIDKDFKLYLQGKSPVSIASAYVFTSE